MALGYIQNWSVNYDWMCLGMETVNSAATWYFIGFAVGYLLFFTPDAFGRRKAMLFQLFFSLIGVGLLTYGDTLVAKSIGFFIKGVNHLTITTSLTHCTELLCDRHKALGQTFILFFDSSSLFFVGIWLLYFHNKIQPFMEFSFWIGVLGCLLYVLIIPEAPIWHFM
jgi:hypothetical protein